MTISIHNKLTGQITQSTLKLSPPQAIRVVARMIAAAPAHITVHVG